MSLIQKTALITGATRGIGFAIANTLAKQGVNTLLIGRDSQRVQDAERVFREKYKETQHQGVQLDIGNKDAINETLKVDFYLWKKEKRYIVYLYTYII